MRRLLLKPHISILVFVLLVQLSYGQLNALQAADSMGRGINLGNTLEPPDEGDWAPLAQQHFFEDYADFGFNTVRVPVRWFTHTSTSAPYDIDTDWLNRVEEVIDWGLDQDLWVIINLHHENEFKVNYSTYLNMYLAIWDQLLVRFGPKAHKLIFEIINEPHGMAEADLNSFNQLIYDKIRLQSSTRLIMYGGDNWSNSGDLINGGIDIPGPGDPYLMGYYHSYDPWDWGSGGGTWGTTANKDARTNQFQSVANWSTNNSIPVVLGEFGANGNWDENSVYRYYAHITDEAIQKNVVPVAWDTDNNNFWIYRRDQGRFTELAEICVRYTPESVTDFVPTAGAGQVSLSWTNRATGANEILVQRRPESNIDLDYTTIATIDAGETSYTDYGLAADDYLYRVITYESNGEAHYGYPQRVTVSGGGTTCSSPDLGDDTLFCGISSLTLDSKLGSAGRTFEWSKDGSVLGSETSPTYNATQFGTYMVRTDEGGCIRTSVIELKNEIEEVDLGSGVNLCDPIEYTIDPGTTNPVFSYSWKLDGTAIGTSQSIVADKPGNYELTISASGCLDMKSSIEVTSALVDVSGDTLCAAGTADLMINEVSGSYSWHDSSTGGNQLSTNTNYSPSIVSTTTYYVQDDGATTHNVGKTTQDGNLWSQTTDYTLWGRDMDIVASTDLTIESFDIFTNDALDLQINITGPNSFNYVYNQSGLPNSGNSPVTIPINVFLPAGTYYVTLLGTTGRVDIQADNQGSNSYPGLISFECTDDGNMYGYFYNWVVTEGAICQRTPVDAVLDPGNASCDCNSEWDGTASIDNCAVCSGGNTGITPNSTCSQDCNGDWDGTASVDNCSVCSGGNTGITPNSTCTQDCNGDWDGTASVDNCSVCSGGNTGITPNSTCSQDCNGDWGGTAAVDNCAVCSGGNTGITVDDCLTSVSSLQSDKAINVSPNPSAGIFNLSQSAAWLVVDVVGNVITSGESDKIDLSDYARGVYLVKVQGQVIRILKQ